MVQGIGPWYGRSPPKTSIVGGNTTYVETHLLKLTFAEGIPVRAMFVNDKTRVM